MNFNPARLSTARKRRMLNKKSLAEQIGVGLRTVVRWEQSQTEEPTPENVDALARVLEYPKEFFFGQDIDEPIAEHVSFRSQTAMSAAEREAALAAGKIGFMISDWVVRHFDLPQPEIPDLHLFGPEEAARMLRQQWGLGEKPIPNMIHVLESKGVRVLSLAENTTRVNAYALWRKGCPFVFLNSVKSPESSRFDAAHELGHLVLHQDGGVTGRPAEDQANQFASAFLMPEADVRASLPFVRSLNELIAWKKRWRVSLAALNYRVHRLGLVSDWKYRDFCISIAQRGFHRQEPDSIERESSAVWDKVLKCLWTERITILDIAEQLALPGQEVQDLLFGIMRKDVVDPNSGPRLPLSVVPEGAD